ncbi:unnamed protein product [Closterium sp. NIES-53]
MGRLGVVFAARMSFARHAEFGDEAERPRWSELLRSGVDIFALDYDAILAAMYALFVSVEGDCYLCVLANPGIEVVALGASESALPCTATVEALHTFTLDSGASRYLARSSIVLPCPAVPSGSLSGLHLPSFSTNLVSTAALQDAMVTTTTLGGQRVSICTCTRTGRHLATFIRRPGSSLYTLTTEPPQVAGSTQVSASGPVAAPCSYRLLSHQTLLWHHLLGHPSLPRIRGMHSRLLVSGLPRSLPPLTPSPAPPSPPCVKGWQRATPHSSSFPPTSAPLQTLHMDVRGPARVSGQDRQRYFLLVVDDYTRYTTVFPLRSKGQVPDVLIPWIRTVRLQLRKRFRQDLPVPRLHSDKGGEFSSDLLREFCRGQGILQLLTLPASPQQNGVAERRIGLVMEVAHLAYTLLDGEGWRCICVPGLGSRTFVHDTFADKLSSHAIPCVFHGFPPDVRGRQFYHPTSRRALPSQDVTFDESVPFYRLFPYRTAPLSPLPLFLAPGPPPVEPPPLRVALPQVAARGATSGGAASGGGEPASADPRGAEPEGAEPGGAESRGAEPGGSEPGGTEPEGVEPGGAETEGAKSGGAEPWGTASAGGPAGASPRLWRPRAGGAGAGGIGAGDPGAGGTGVGGARAGGTGAGGTVQQRPFFVPPPPSSLPPPDSVLRHFLSLPSVKITNENE